MEATTLAGRTVRLEVPPRPDYVVLARLALSAVCRLTPLEPEAVADLKLAITEAAAGFVGEGDVEAARLDPSAGGGDDGEAAGSLDFVFVLGEDRLELEIGCAGGLTVSDDEVMEALTDSAERGNVKPKKLLDRLRSEGRLDSVKDDMAARKAVDLVVDSAKPIEPGLEEARKKLWTPGS